MEIRGHGSRPPPPRPRALLARYPAPGQLLFIFDFDGTLVEIAPTPEQVRLPEPVYQALERVSQAGLPLLFCSGRAIRDLRCFLPSAPGIDFIGNHGCEWETERGGRERFTPPGWEEWKRAFLPRLKEEIERHGGELENKGSSFSLHYRLSGREYWSSPQGLAWLREASHPLAKILPGTELWNILPQGASKGEAVLRYLDRRPFQQVVYIGDEPTDETVFALGDRVPWSIKVGEGETLARYRLESVSEVQDWVLELGGIGFQ